MEDRYAPGHREADKSKEPTRAIASHSSILEPPCERRNDDARRNDSTASHHVSAFKLSSLPKLSPVTTANTISAHPPRDTESEGPAIFHRAARSLSEATTPPPRSLEQSEYDFNMELFSPKLREQIAEEDAKTPPAARPLLRRSTSDAFKSQQLAQQQMTPIPELEQAVEEEEAPRPLLRRQRSSTYQSYTTEEHSSRPSLTLSPPTGPASPVVQAPPTIQAPRPVRPGMAARRISHEVQQRQQNLMEELNDLRGQMKNQEVRRSRDMEAVGFSINRILEQQANQMRVQQLLMERLTAMNLQTAQAQEAAEAAQKAAEAERRAEEREASGDGAVAEDESGKPEDVQDIHPMGNARQFQTCEDDTGQRRARRFKPRWATDS